MGAAPRMSRRLPHNRLFGAAIVAAGLALVLVALAPHLFARHRRGDAGRRLRGHRVPHRPDDHRRAGRRRGPRPDRRVRAVDRAADAARLDGAGPAASSVWWRAHGRAVRLPYRIDGTRVVMLAGGLVAAVVGMLAYRQMDDRRTEPAAARPARRAAPGRAARGLRDADRGRGRARGGDGRAGRRGWPRGCAPRATPSSRRRRRPPIASAGPAPLREARCRGRGRGRWRRRRCAADQVERVVRPALAAARSWWPTGSSPSPLVQFGVAADRMRPSSDPASWRDLAAWATGRLRPDVSVLLDRAPARCGLRRDVRAGR